MSMVFDDEAHSLTVRGTGTDNAEPVTFAMVAVGNVATKREGTMRSLSSLPLRTSTVPLRSEMRISERRGCTAPLPAGRYGEAGGGSQDSVYCLLSPPPVAAGLSRA